MRTSKRLRNPKRFQRDLDQWRKAHGYHKPTIHFVDLNTLNINKDKENEVFSAALITTDINVGSDKHALNENPKNDIRFHYNTTVDV